MEMDIDKRYCQNRQRKRKRTKVASPVENRIVSPSEEERQFKLRRFVDDVGKFLSEKEGCHDKKLIPKTKTCSKPQNIVKKVILPKSMISKSIGHHGIQTKFCRRGGVMTREMTAKLDENLKQIISLTNDNRCNHQCYCSHRCKENVEQQSGSSSQHGLETQTTSILRTLQTRSSVSGPGSLLPQSSPASPVGLVGAEASPDSTRNAKTLEELDKELYPLFARIVSVSCTQTKAKHFKNQSYVSAVKKKLLHMKFLHTNKIIGSKQEHRCLKESKATSSIGTSPFPSPVGTQSSHSNRDPPFKLAPAKLQFQSTMQFLEETIGPSSSSSKRMAPSPQCYQPSLQFSQPHRQHQQLSLSLLSPPVVTYQRPRRVSSYFSKVSKYVNEPFIPTSPCFSPLYSFKSKVFDGIGDEFGFNCSNSFLPPIEEEEDSPDFRYYPRKRI